MTTITADRFIDGVYSIYEEKPAYRKGGDGSDGTCDCIGMPRGALKREGVTDVKNMGGTNMAARKAIENLREISSVSALQPGDVVLKVRDKDDPNYPLPDRYRKGHADYDQRWGETNFTHIGTVTGVNPLEITHMTSPTAKKDTKLGNWKFVGQLPWVKRGADPEPVPEGYAVVTGKKVALRTAPTTQASVILRVNTGEKVKIEEPPPSEWEYVSYKGKTGYMMKAFLKEGESNA